jgi:hypothetical protein
MDFKWEMGSKSKTKTVGLIGIITARSENLYGCNRYYVQPAAGKDMKVPEGFWVDEDDVTILEKPKAPRKAKNTGGPMSKRL